MLYFGCPSTNYRIVGLVLKFFKEFWRSKGSCAYTMRRGELFRSDGDKQKRSSISYPTSFWVLPRKKGASRVCAWLARKIPPLWLAAGLYYVCTVPLATNTKPVQFPGRRSRRWEAADGRPARRTRTLLLLMHEPAKIIFIKSKYHASRNYFDTK